MHCFKKCPTFIKAITPLSDPAFPSEPPNGLPEALQTLEIKIQASRLTVTQPFTYLYKKQDALEPCCL